eukprot:NODE_316_length_9983_cov_1.089741.p4 type:complete len:305 gc:universal NODE_316_length_9983_cov_1.089741:6866-7780(+)
MKFESFEEEMNYYQQENERIRKRAEQAFKEAENSIQNAGIDFTEDSTVHSNNINKEKVSCTSESANIQETSLNEHTILEKIEKKLQDDEKFIQSALKLENTGSVITQEASLRFYQAKCLTLEEEFIVMKKELQALKLENANLVKSNKSSKIDIDKTQNEVQIYKTKELKLNEELSHLKDENLILRKQFKDNLKDLEVLKGKQKNSQTSLDSKENRVARAMEEVARVKKQLEQAEYFFKTKSENNNSKLSHVIEENTRLKKLINEMETAIKKQTQQISVIKKQKVHSTASRDLLDYLKSTQLNDF